MLPRNTRASCLAPLACVLLLLICISAARAAAEEGAAGTDRCRECHDLAPRDHVERLLMGSHGISADAGFSQGCEDCHGASAAHADAPREVAPSTSFGPRWSASGAAQDAPCLGCHEQDTRGDWRHALHMLNNLTCVTCHDIHAEEDRALIPERQAELCTMCHKAQKAGANGLADDADREPPCSSCHDPHDHETARERMRDNGSAGCLHCHDPAWLTDHPLHSERARQYHRVASDPGNTCLDCHQGIAHAPAASTPAMTPTASPTGRLTLFYPGPADSDWLLRAHPGSQPLRQGSPCQRCHRGEEAALGKARAGGSLPGSRDIQATFARDGESLQITLQWQGPADDRLLSIMWGDGRNAAFRLGGCFAACHGDLPGMSSDRGAGTGKYLQVSRVGAPGAVGRAGVRDERELRELAEEGEFVELWRVDLASAAARRALLLDDLRWQGNNRVEVTSDYRAGTWTVTLSANLEHTGEGVRFVPEGRYVLGIALHGADNPASGHWVSLPQTLSFGGDDTDFTAE